MPLTAVAVKSAKASDKPQKLTDSQGLYLLITKGGSKLWRYDYRFDGKRKTLALGQYDAVSLAAAREKRDEARATLAAGADPAKTKKIIASDGLFESVARRWMAAQKGTLAAITYDRKMGRMEKSVFPFIGGEQLSALTETEMLAVLRPIEARAASSARRIRGYCSEVFLFGAAEGHCDPYHNPCERLARVLKKPARTKHFSTVKTDELPALLVAIDGYDGDVLTRYALRWTMMTMVRTSETRGAEWTEFEGLDTDEPIWRIPSHRMKMGLEHIVPLSRQAVELLEAVHALRRSERLVFPGRFGRDPMSENTMLFALYRIGFHRKQTVHGFRSLASTWLNSNGQNGDWVERQLAHADPNQIRAAYNSAEWLPERRKMLALWADTLDGMLLDGRLG